MAAACKIII